MSVADKYFKDAVNKILTEGVSDEAFSVRPKWPDGISAHTRKIHCYVARYNLAEEFPILTLRTQAFKSCVKEILFLTLKKRTILRFWRIAEYPTVQMISTARCNFLKKRINYPTFRGMPYGKQKRTFRLCTQNCAMI